ncbi:MAG: hypothetical protein KGH75_09740 [Rhodospirillales bacterium]|nr:hypothetical protein [Rhodospirillales bacterium]
MSVLHLTQAEYEACKAALLREIAAVDDQRKLEALIQRIAIRQQNKDK